MCCCFPSKKIWTKNISPKQINIKPKPKVNLFVNPLVEGNSPKSEPYVDKRIHVIMDSILLKEIDQIQIIVKSKYKA